MLVRVALRVLVSLVLSNSFRQCDKQVFRFALVRPDTAKTLVELADDFREIFHPRLFYKKRAADGDWLNLRVCILHTEWDTAVAVKIHSFNNAQR
ncbi:hypothetical protein [Candidatus Desulfovibrio trichonymphae]|uniref:hypothetical protein n=1 Tax=Candidatus Desulfovibrio trichonymphae TaxID=1725232 RepID=UPI000BBACFBA|nr:hypothetical protein [Candidatus Desulfovibrio trichonymphae]